MITANQLLPNSDAVVLLSKLDELKFEINWAKNTDLSINGHVTDAALWVTQTLAEQRLNAMSLAILCVDTFDISRQKLYNSSKQGFE